MKPNRDSKDEAISKCRAVVRLNPESADTHFNLGNALYDDGDMKGAVAEFNEALRLDPKHEHVHQLLGLALAQTNDWAGAIAAHRSGLQLRPDNPNGHNFLGFLLCHNGDYEGAIDACRAALRISPAYADAHSGLGYALNGVGDRRGAAAEFREALQLDPNLAEAHSGLGRVLWWEGDWDGALIELRETVRLDPNDAFSHLFFADVLLKKGDVDAAIVESREVVRLKPVYAGGHVKLGHALIKKGDFDGAISALNQAINLESPNPHTHYHLGVAKYKKGDHNGAVVEFRYALLLSPNYQDARCLLGCTLEALTDLDGAIAAYREVLMAKPDDAFAQHRLAAALDRRTARKETIPDDAEIAAELDRSGPLADNRGSLVASPSQNTRGLAKVAGMQELKSLLWKEVVRPLREPELFRAYGITIPNGILLYGPPGCGKTFISRQLAEELGYYFIEVLPSTVASPYIHQSVSNIRSVFETAGTHAPALVFIDEFEALVPSRSKLGGHQQYKSEEVNEFLVHLGSCSEKQVLVIAATNEPEMIDAAVLRTGRLDKLVYVGPPDLNARADMLRQHLSHRPVDGSIDIDRVALILDAYSASDIKFLVDEAARMALDRRLAISNDILAECLSRVPPSVTKQLELHYSSFKPRGI